MDADATISVGSHDSVVATASVPISTAGIEVDAIADVDLLGGTGLVSVDADATAAVGGLLDATVDAVVEVGGLATDLLGSAEAVVDADAVVDLGDAAAGDGVPGGTEVVADANAVVDLDGIVGGGTSDGAEIVVDADAVADVGQLVGVDADVCAVVALGGTPSTCDPAAETPAPAPGTGEESDRPHQPTLIDADACVDVQVLGSSWPSCGQSAAPVGAQPTQPSLIGADVCADVAVLGSTSGSCAPAVTPGAGDEPAAPSSPSLIGADVCADVAVLGSTSRCSARPRAPAPRRRRVLVRAPTVR